MRVWFVLGIEPWFLPPVVEMGHALVTEGHETRAIYLGDEASAGDEVGFPTMSRRRRPGILRIIAPVELSSLLRRALRSDEYPDLVIACDPVALQAARSLRRRIRALGYWGFEIIQPPGSFRISADAWRARQLGRWVRDCDMVLAPSSTRLDQLTRLGYPRAQALVVPNCRCDGAHRCEPPPTVDSHPVARLPRRLVYAGRVSATQHIGEIVGALRFLPDDVGLIIAGIAFPEYRRRLENDVKSFGLSDRCLLLGRVSRAQADGLIADATLGFVLYDSTADPGAADPAPNKVGDYAAYGVPMVGTRQEYLRYWLQERGLGICVAEASPEAIAAATRSLLDPSRLACARASCTAAAQSDLNMRTHARKLIQALQTSSALATP